MDKKCVICGENVKDLPVVVRHREVYMCPFCIAELYNAIESAGGIKIAFGNRTIDIWKAILKENKVNVDINLNSNVIEINNDDGIEDLDGIEEDNWSGFSFVHVGNEGEEEEEEGYEEELEKDYTVEGEWNTDNNDLKDSFTDLGW